MLYLHEEAARCLLCADAPCSKACRNSDPARAIRAVRFGNEAIARHWVALADEAELEAAEKACIHYDRPVRIREMVRALPQTPGQAGGDGGVMAGNDRPSLAIDFCGIRCENPFFLASSAVCTNYEMVARAFEAGWAGVFYKTICLQEIREVSPRFDAVRNNANSSFIGFRNMEQLSENPVEMDFDILRRLKQNYPSKVVIASIMGQQEADWTKLAKMAEDAGCDAVELNFSCPQMRAAGMGCDVGQDSELVTFFTACVKRSVHIPVIPKMTPNIAHISEPAMAAVLGGADAISAINTIKSVTLGEGSEVNGCQTGSGYSGKAVKPIALRHILAMVKNPIISHKELSGVGGIETWRDALEFIQLGCRNVQVCTSVMEYGYRIIDDLILGLQNYMAQRSIGNLADLVGELLPKFYLPHDLDRDTVVYPKIDREKCIGCGRCYTSCADGGHQAISFGPDRRPRVNGAKCVGCLLCRLVCPTGAITPSKRVKK
ncbi:MAG: NAD-dependent dihydropyrimidine dehydrogenase subunit PreA [Bacteroidales bacterium]|nr:NAD-dependent dihydropyrimidine dehydrogenase subunit PreA [Bacteroidales bacterium]